MAGTSRSSSLARMSSRLTTRGVGNIASFTVEREKELQEAFFKACSNEECPPKEKHVRTITISTWKERTAQTFWMILQRLPYQSQPVICWKLINVIHKVILNGHPTVIRESIKWVDLVEQMRRHWNYCDTGYPHLIALYGKLIRQKIILHRKWPIFPSSLNMQEKQWKLPENDINLYFQLAVDCFEYLDTMLRLVKGVKENSSGTAQFSTAMIHCRMCPYICMIPESYGLYGIIVKIMQRLFSSLPTDTLDGHNTRFTELYRQLNRFYVECQSIRYIEGLLGIPCLDDKPPDFAKHAAYSPPPRPRDPQPVGLTEGLINIETDGKETDGREDTPPQDDKDQLIQQLLREVCELRKKLTLAHQNYQQLGNEIRELESTRDLLNEERTSLEDKLSQLQCTPTKEAELTQKLAESEVRWRDTLDRCDKLKQAYANLRKEHINLIRSSAETKKSLESQQQLLKDITQQLQNNDSGSVEQLKNLEIEVLKLDSEKQESERRLAALQKELQEISEHDNEMRQENCVLQYNLQDMTRQASEARRQADKITLDLDGMKSEHEEMRKNMNREQAKLLTKLENDKKHIERDVLRKAEADCFLETVAHIKNYQNKTLYKLNKAECAQTCTIDECAAVVDNAQNTVKNIVVNSRWNLLSVADKISDLQNISQEYSVMAICARAVMPCLPSDKATELYRRAENVITSYMAALQSLTSEDNLSVMVEGATKQLASLLHDLSSQCAKENTNMDNIVDQEMTATAAAVNEAAQKIQEIQDMTRQQYTGIELEVGERILGSCTDLMTAVRELILSSAELQREIVSCGKLQAGGTATEFYKRHSRWTEGLLSAAKAVGWGASSLVSTADDVVGGTGKFELLEVTSHEIAASTAQLVAASRVKADKDSSNFSKVMVTSKAVSKCAAAVVAASKQCMKLTEESKIVSVDYSQLSAVQVKRLDMEMQVSIKELENSLTLERRKLATMRKMHYHTDIPLDM